MSGLEFGQDVHGDDFPTQAFEGTINAFGAAEKNQSSHFLCARFSPRTFLPPPLHGRYGLLTVQSPLGLLSHSFGLCFIIFVLFGALF